MSLANKIINRQKQDRNTNSTGSSEAVPSFPNIDLNSCHTRIIKSRATPIGTMAFRYKSPATPNSSSNKSRSQDKISVNIPLATSIMSTINLEHISLTDSNSNSNNQPIHSSYFPGTLPAICQTAGNSKTHLILFSSSRGLPPPSCRESAGLFFFQNQQHLILALPPDEFTR